MESWELDFEWLRIRHFVKDRFSRKALPDLNSILFLIGVQELGYLQDEFTKEEKQDLMHIAVCTLLSPLEYYEWVGRDQDGWPHYKPTKQIDAIGVEEQEKLLKEQIVEYFRDVLTQSSSHGD